MDCSLGKLPPDRPSSRLSKGIERLSVMGCASGS
jgi:hypothetical protein